MSWHLHICLRRCFNMLLHEEQGQQTKCSSMGWRMISMPLLRLFHELVKASNNGRRFKTFYNFNYKQKSWVKNHYPNRLQVLCYVTLHCVLHPVCAIFRRHMTWSNGCGSTLVKTLWGQGARTQGLGGSHDGGWRFVGSQPLIGLDELLPI